MVSHGFAKSALRQRACWFESSTFRHYIQGMRINWQRILFISFIAMFVFNIGACQYVWSHVHDSCNPRVIATCEP